MADEDEVVIQLVMKGADPAQARRAVASTMAAVQSELQSALNRQVDAQKKAGQDIERESKKASAASSTAWRKMLGDLRDVTIVATGAFRAITGGAGKLKEFAEDVVRVSNVYGSLKGSIESAKRAVEGTVSTYDLISAKNRAASMDLELTEEQFAAVAFSADKFADEVGTDVKEALDKLITSLASGRKATLAKAGVVVDATKAERDFAAAIGTTADRLNEEGKRIALQTAALEKMKERMVDAGDAMERPANMSLVMEQAIVAISDGWNKLLSDIGSWQPPEWLADIITLGGRGKDRAKAELDRLKRETAGFEAGSKVLDEMAAGTYVKPVEPNPYALPEGKTLADVTTAAKERQKRREADTLDYLFSDQAQRDAEAEMEAGITGAERDVLDNDIARARAKRQFAVSNFDTDVYAAAMKTSAAAAAGFDDEQLRQSEEIADQLSDVVDRVREEIGAKAFEDAGGGILARLLFGVDGPDELTRKLTDFEIAVTKSIGLVANAGEGMASAFGDSIAASIAGEKGFVEAMKDGTRQVLKSLVARAATEALMQTALGLSQLAIGNVASAGTHFASAAAFASVATVAGVGLAAIGSGGKQGAGSRATESRSPSFAGVSRGGDDRDRSQSPVNLIVNVAPGGEAEAGRSIVRALEAYEAQTGRKVLGRAA